MVAYNFQKQFTDPIKRGTKSHTIRRNSKRRHAQPGEKLQLYTGMRTKHCQKILATDPKCVFVKQVVIDISTDEINAIWVDGVRVQSLDDFAKMDGFKSLKAMHTFWIKFHGPGMFIGSIIGWEWKKPHAQG